MASEGDGIAKLAELVRQGERLIDQQIRASEEQDSKTQNAISVSLLLAAGVAALLNLGLRELEFPRAWPLQPFILMCAGSMVTLGVAVWYFATTYTALAGFKAEFRIGWDAKKLKDVGENPQLSAEDVHLGTLNGLPGWFSFNEETLRKQSARRAAGTGFLLGSAGLAGLGLIYLSLAFL